jgi:Terminase large subunit, ATPase domain
VTKLERARDWLSSVLPRPAREVATEAAAAGISQATLRRAAVALKVVKERVGDPGSPMQSWVWSLQPERLERDTVGVSVAGDEHLSPEPLEVLTGLRLEDGRTWGEAATPLQWSDAQAILAREPEVRRFWIGRSRGYSKTTDTAGFTIAAALGGLIPPGEKGFCTAADRDQAALVSEAVNGFVRRTDELRGVVVVERNTIKFGSVGVTVEVLSSDAPSAWGRRGHLWVLDEVTAWSDTPAMRAFYEAVSTAWPKVPTCRVIVISTAGSPAHFSRREYETALEDSRWRVSDSHDIAPWIEPDDIEAERRRLSAGSFARLWENRWTEAEDHLVTAESLARCVTLTSWPAQPVRGTRYVIGVDVGVKSDATAIAVAHSETVDSERRVVLDAMEVFRPKRGAQVSLAQIERRVEELARRFGDAQVLFDPTRRSRCCRVCGPGGCASPSTSSPPGRTTRWPRCCTRCCATARSTCRTTASCSMSSSMSALSKPPPACCRSIRCRDGTTTRSTRSGSSPSVSWSSLRPGRGTP